MKFKKASGGNYILIKVNPGDKKYLQAFKRYESAKIVKNTDEYLSEMVTMHIKTILVMTTAKILARDGEISKGNANAVFGRLDKALTSYDRILDKYLVKFGNLLNGKTKRRRKRQKT
jgi:hypothetical protein